MVNREVISGPAYRIQTARLVIRCWHPDDAALLKAAIDANVDYLRQWMPWAAHEPTSLQKKVELLRGMRAKFDLGQDFTYGIFNSDELRVLGGTGLHLRSGPGSREIGYWIHRAYANRGLATEAAGALTRVAFLVDEVSRVEIRCDPRNLASAAVASKLGFNHEATLRQREMFGRGDWRDVMVWSLRVEEFPNSPAAAITMQAYDVLDRPIAL
jgi:RimJ/RimL family protein N-acetyltransferase